MNRFRCLAGGFVGWFRAVSTTVTPEARVPGEIRRLDRFRSELSRSWRHALLRRSQRRRMPWSRFHRLVSLYLPSVRVLHPYPNQRFTL